MSSTSIFNPEGIALRGRGYNNSFNSSDVNSACLRISERVPFARVECCGTTVRRTLSPILFSSETWLPFCRRTTNPTRLSARTSRSPEMLGNRGTSPCNLDERPERLLRYAIRFGRTPRLKIKLDGFPQTRPGRFNVLALRRHTEFGAAGHIPIVFFGNQGREAVVHGIDASGMERTRASL